MPRSRRDRTTLMQLHYLDFEFSDEDSGRGSFDAMASVLPARLPALLGEIGAVLRWAAAAFGPAGALQGEGEWDYELQGIAEPDTPLAVTYDDARGEVSLPSGMAPGRTTLTMTITGSAMFCEAFRDAFGTAD
jgi:hypothetical protein